MFKVGDIVIGNEKAKPYGVTTTGYIGEVVKIIDENLFTIRGKNGEEWDVLCERFDLYRNSELCNKIEQSNMSVLLRKDYQWTKVIFDIEQNIVRGIDGTYSAWDIIDIKNDERCKYVQCKKCGKILLNTEEAKQEHSNRYKSLDICIKCRWLIRENALVKTETMIANDDGGYNISTSIDCKCYCGNHFSRIDIKEAKETICQYKGCDNFLQLNDVHVKYPQAFSKIATVDALDNAKWKIDYGKTTNTHYTFKASKRFILYAVVNKMGIIDYFVYRFRDSEFVFVYSEKYHKLFWRTRYGGIAEESSACINKERYNELLEIVSKIYKGE